MELNIELFERAKAYMREEPKRANMSIGLVIGQAELKATYTWTDWSAEDIPPCSTVGCIAGTLNLLSMKRRPKHRIENFVSDVRRAISAAGIDKKSIRAGETGHPALFHVESWPRDLRTQYALTGHGTAERVEIICAAIDKFVADPEGF